MPKLSQAEKKLSSARRVRVNSVRKVAQEEISPLSLLHNRVIRQVQEEYDLSWSFMKPKIDEWLVRLKLYNNQKRDKTAVGDPHIFTIHQTIIASLYDDKLGVNFLAREEGDEDRMENLNSLSLFDYHEMEKEVLDYEWIFDSSFFGRGLCLLNNFDIKSKTPIPEILDPTTFLRDPRAASVNGDRMGRKAMRFGGYEVGMTRREMQDNPEYFNLDSLQRDSGMDSLMSNARQQRNQAQGLTDGFNLESNLSENFEHNILRWFTFVDGERYVVELGNERTLLVRLTKLPWRQWPIIDRPLYPISHDWDGISVPDLTEDKQRMRSVLQNLGVDIVKADLNGQYLFREDRFRPGQDFTFRFGKWIPVKGQGSLQDAAQPLQTKQITNSVKFIMDLLDVASQKATATPELQQGATETTKRTLGELELVASKVDTRYSLSAKIFGWSERKFWEQWYNVYDEFYADGLGKKTLRLTGAFGTKWTDISRKEIITDNRLGPDIEIESKIISEARKARSFNQMMALANLISNDPEADALYYKRELARQIMSKDKVERLYPLTPDEVAAKEENEKLNDGKLLLPHLEDDHIAHLRMHNGDTEEMIRHRKGHFYFLMQKRKYPPQQYPGLFPALPSDQLNQLKVAPQSNPAMASPPPQGATGVPA